MAISTPERESWATGRGAPAAFKEFESDRWVTACSLERMVRKTKPLQSRIRKVSKAHGRRLHSATGVPRRGMMNSGAGPARQITPLLKNTHDQFTLAPHAQAIAYGDSWQRTERDLYSLSWLRTLELSDRPLCLSGFQMPTVEAA